MAAVVWTACTPSLDDLGQANVDVLLDVDLFWRGTEVT